MHAKRALMWVLFWVSLAAGFSYFVFRFAGTEAGIEFITCYVVEWTLSVDNLFVFIMIFDAFGVNPDRQLRALTWGIIGAIVLRLVFIYLGVTLVGIFEPILYFFGALLIYSAYRMAFQPEGKKDVKNNRLVRILRKRFPITRNFVGDKFFIRKRGMLIATPMFLVLVTIESSDVMFAIDSIPAAFAITRNPMIIFTANMFAILGLRSLYFVLSHADRAFRFLKYGVVIILAYVGFKMILVQVIHINPYISLGIIAVCLSGSMLLSALIKDNRSLESQ